MATSKAHADQLGTSDSMAWPSHEKVGLKLDRPLGLGGFGEPESKPINTSTCIVPAEGNRIKP